MAKAGRKKKNAQRPAVGEAAIAPGRKHVLLAFEFYAREIHEGVVEYAKKKGWVVDSRMAHTRRLPEHWVGDGVILCGSQQEFFDRVAEFRLPTVSTIGKMGDYDFPVVKLADREAGRLAAEHLMERGFEHLAFYEVSMAQAVIDRRDGFRAAVEKAGRNFHHIRAADGGFMPENRQAAMRWLAERIAELPTPLGAFSSADIYANELMYAASMIGHGVPEQVAVVGVDNNPLYTETGLVPLTSVDNNLKGLGYSAAKLLDQVMEGESVPTEPIVIAPKGLVTRHSTEILAIDHPHVARAVAYIYQNYRDPITVDLVGQQVDISLRQLQYHFKRHMNRTIHDQIIRLRMEHAISQLLTTDKKIEEIACESGFSCGKYFGLAFKEMHKCSPRAFRKQNGVSTNDA